MKKRLFFWCVLIGIFFSEGGAQVQIQGMLPTVGLVQKNQLWNLVVVNGTTNDMEGIFELKLIDRISGMEVLTAVTSAITVKKGGNTININNLAPIQYNYLSISPDNTLNGLLPIGKYLACYTFIRQIQDYQEVVVQECFSFDVEALSPPLLIYPQDSMLLNSMPSQFSWVPPAPATIFQSLRYDLFIAEVLPGQLATEAVQENTPFYTSSNLNTNVFNYSAVSTAFEKDKWYAWQVIAKDGMQYAGKSEAWVFSVLPIEDSTIMSENNINYTLLSDDPQRATSVALENHKMYVKHYSYSTSYIGVMRIVSSTGDTIQMIEQPIQYGDNYLQIDITPNAEKRTNYTLVLTDPQGKKYTALFNITDKTTH